MKQGRSSGNDSAGKEAEVEKATPSTDETATSDVDTSEDRRSALRAAIGMESEDEGTAAASSPETSTQTEKPKEELPPLEPPAEYDAQEKELFRQSSRPQQEAAIRLHRSRQNAYAQASKLLDNARDFLETMGERGTAPQQAIPMALQLWRQFNGDPVEAIISYAKSRRIDPKVLLEKLGVTPPSEGGEKKSDVAAQNGGGQNDLTEIKNYIAEEMRSKEATRLGTLWSQMETAKNAAGAARFPDLNNTPAGIEVCSKMGALYSDPEFKRAMRYLLPNLTDEGLALQAYIAAGGRVDDSSEAPNPSHGSHIARTRRASASIPGRGAQTGPSNGKKYGSYREAAKAALASLRSQDAA